jgi:hypothetical protein
MYDRNIPVSHSNLGKQATRKNDFIFRYPIALPQRNEPGKETRFEQTSELPVEKSNDHSPVLVLSFILAFFLYPILCEYIYSISISIPTALPYMCVRSFRNLQLVK